MLNITFAVWPSTLKSFGIADLMASDTSLRLNTCSIACLLSCNHCCTTAWKLSPLVPCLTYCITMSPSFSNWSIIGGMMR